MKTFRKSLHARIASTVLGKLLLSGTLLGILNVQTVFERYQQLLRLLIIKLKLLYST